MDVVACKDSAGLARCVCDTSGQFSLLTSLQDWRNFTLTVATTTTRPATSHCSQSPDHSSYRPDIQIYRYQDRSQSSVIHHSPPFCILNVIKFIISLLFYGYFIN